MSSRKNEVTKTVKYILAKSDYKNNLGGIPIYPAYSVIANQNT